MSNPWIRLYREALHNPKIVTLSDRQHRVWHNLLLIADDTGMLPRTRDIACHLRLTMQEAEQAIQELMEAGLVDPNVLGPGARRFKMHDWQSHQYQADSSAERTREYRKRLKEKDVTTCDTSRDVTVTPPDTDTDTDTDTESEPDTEITLAHSSFVKPREKVKEQSFNSDLKTKKKESRIGRNESVVRRAEGLGLPVDEIIETVNGNAKKSRPGYFTTLCVSRLQAQLPGIDEQLIRDALWGKDGKSFGLLCQALLEVA